MKRVWMSVKQLAEEYGVSADSVYRAYRNGDIPGHQMARIIRFNLDEVRQATKKRAKAMPNSHCTKGAIDGRMGNSSFSGASSICAASLTRYSSS